MLKSAQEYFHKKNTSLFDTVIPKRADLDNVYGQPFGSNLYGYEDAYRELEEATETTKEGRPWQSNR